MVTGTRIPVRVLLGKRNAGSSDGEIARSYRISEDSVRKVLLHIERPLHKKRRERCVLFLDDCFDADDAPRKETLRQIERELAADSAAVCRFIAAFADAMQDIAHAFRNAGRERGGGEEGGKFGAGGRGKTGALVDGPGEEFDEVAELASGTGGVRPDITFSEGGLVCELGVLGAEELEI